MSAQSNKSEENREKYKNAALIATISFAFLIVAFLGYMYWQRFEVIFDLRSQLDRLQEERARLVRENAELRQKLIRKNDLDYIRELAKEKLGLVQPETEEN